MSFFQFFLFGLIITVTGIVEKADACLTKEIYFWLIAIPYRKKKDKSGVIHDPLGQTHSHAKIFFYLKICLFCYMLKKYLRIRTICVK